MSERYCLDTSFLINGWNKRYRIDVFPSLWEALDEMMHDGSVFSCTDVLKELEEKEDALYKWAKKRRSYFEGPTEDVTLKMSVVMAQFPNFAAQAGSKNSADPWIIAHALVANAIVVTDEHEADKQKASKPPKIPNVCKELGVLWMPPIDFLAKVRIKY